MGISSMSETIRIGTRGSQLALWQAERVSYLPDSLLPANKLQDYLGPSLLAAVTALSAPGVTEPISINNGFALLQLIELQPAAAQPFEAAQPQVIETMRRERGEQALRELLQDLRSDYRVVMANE